MSDALPPIHCSFECEGAPALFTVVEGKYAEFLSQPFALELTLRALSLAIHPELLIGRSCHFTFDRGALLRSVHGIIEEIELVGDAPPGAFDDFRTVKVKVVPAFALLEHRKNSRIFQDMSVLQIVRDVLMGGSAPAGEPEGLLGFGRVYDDSALDESAYAPNRDYCVQYKESDFAFVSRLLEEEGIAYHFEHMRMAHEIMLLGDTNLTYPPIETLAVMPFLRLLVHEEQEPEEGLHELSWRRKRVGDKTLFRHWDWLTPHEGSETTHEGSEGAEAVGEVGQPLGRMTSYEHSEERSREENDGDRIRQVHPEGARRARLQHQREKVQEWVAVGKSNATGIQAGRHFTHDGDGMHAVLVTSVEHHFEATDAGDGQNAEYHNTFEAIPMFRTFRPQKKQKRPKIEGPQTASVTGPEGEEIHTDNHGRIKVLMNWDRDGEGGHRRERRHDAASSVWVRVAQLLAGSGWGAVFLPRVGMEVVVHFLDGNPDRPLVTGCVYNGRHEPPYPLPDEKTKSTIKSSSSPGGDGYNELRFEDAAGAEQVFVHAQRDYDARVERRHTMQVGENQQYDVEGDRSRTVGGSETVRIDGNQAITVNGGGSEGTKGIEIQVVETYKLSASKDIAASAPDKIRLECQGSVIELTPGKITLRAGDGAEIVLDANVLAKSNDQSKLTMDTKIKAEANEGAKLELASKAELEDSSGSKVTLDSSITLESCEGAKVVLNANIDGEGGEIHLHTMEAEVLLTAVEATLHGIMCHVLADAMVEIDGSGGRGIFCGGVSSFN